MLNVELSPAAQIEFDEAADWYGAEDPDLKVRFIDEINSTLCRTTLAFIISDRAWNRRT